MTGNPRMTSDFEARAQRPEHWSSYNLQESPIHGQSTGRECKIAIALDDDARYQFSAIRLLVVSKQSAHLDSVSVQDFPDTRRALIFQSSPHKNYRYHLATRLDTRQRGRNLAVHHHPICTIVFELVDTSGEVHDSIALKLCPHSSGTSHLRIVYDHVHQSNPTNPSLLVLLYSNKCFSDIPVRYTTGINTHLIRVVPTAGRRPSCVPLQPEIVRQIVKFAVEDKHHGWRAELLSYGLVCKSWAHVLDLFFQSFGGRQDMDKPDALHVVRSLEARPEPGALMRTFNPWDYKYKGPDTHIEHSPEAWHDFLTILEHAILVKAVYLASIPKSIAERLAYALSGLQEVRSLTCKMSQVSRTDSALSMTKIEAIIAIWKHLRVLELSCWTQDETEPASLPQHLLCQIEKLSLTNGTLTISQLTWLTASRTPALKVLVLNAVHGLSNNDFRLFLFSVAPTLTQLSVFHCPIPRSSPTEERAIDAAMPVLEALTHVVANATYVSALALLRKRGRRAGSQSIKSAITIQEATEELCLEQVEEAARVTDWAAVTIVWHVPTLDVRLVQRAVGVAKERGVALECRTAWGW